MRNQVRTSTPTRLACKGIRANDILGSLHNIPSLCAIGLTGWMLSRLLSSISVVSEAGIVSVIANEASQPASIVGYRTPNG